MYEIEKGVAAPVGGAGKATKYPFQSMEVGDSFLIPTSTIDGVRNTQTKLCIAWRRQAPKKFTTRRVDGGVRCWRIE